MLTMLTVPHAPVSAAVVRRHLRADLAGAGLEPGVIEDATVVLSELVGNAVRHARALPDGSVHTAWRLRDDRLTLEVTDAGAATRPQLQPPSNSAIGGRGLSIVEALTGHWGVRREWNRHTTVWAEIDFVPLPEGCLVR